MTIRASDGFSKFRSELNAQILRVTDLAEFLESPPIGHIWWAHSDNITGQIIDIDEPVKIFDPAGPDDINPGTYLNKFTYLAGTLTYTGTVPRHLTASVNIHQFTAAPSSIYVFSLRKNGVEISDSVCKAGVTVGVSGVGPAVFLQSVVYLSAGDTIELWVTSSDDGNVDVRIYGCQIIIK